MEETGVLEMDLGNLSIKDRPASKQMVLYDSGDGDGAVYKPVGKGRNHYDSCKHGEGEVLLISSWEQREVTLGS